MKITSAQFLTGAVYPDQYPELAVPEFAFYGKSNTGKSSLINFITSKRDLVKTSSTPGQTRQINFFLINEAFCLTDLPGVGYSKLSGAVRSSLAPMIETYCKTRANLAGIFYLLDLRREAGEKELATYKQLGQRGIPVMLVGTKADKISANVLRQTTKDWCQLFGIPAESLIITSVLKKVGRYKLLGQLNAIKLP